VITHLSVAARVVITVFVAVTIVLFFALGARFGGPSPFARPATIVHATVADAEGLPTQSDVLIHGVKVGRVTKVGDGRLTLALHHAVHPDAWMRVGSKTPLGEPFVDLDPGHAAGALHGDLPVRPSVEVDEALGLLAPRTRSDLRALLRTTGTGASSASDIGNTVAGLSRATAELRRLGATLRGQSGDVAQTISSSRAVLAELSARDAALRGIVADGTRTLQAAGMSPSDLRAALAQLPDVVARARDTLAEAQPLVAHARPVVADVRAAARPLTQTLRTAVPVLRDAGALTARLPALRRAALPTLAVANRLLPAAGPAFERLGPALADAAPMIRYLAPRANTITAWFANTSALGQNGDAKGKWARFFVMIDPATAVGAPGGPPGNSYTEPDDAAHNAAYKRGDFPRLTALPRPR
jgi:phospholipid/cholesterol/gamma-HCH transport system substrate-binding protein